MSIQLLDIVLYSTRAERRVLSLRPGALNIITGDSKTGKSALISVVDYCRGSSSCAIPRGVIRDNVAWYALRLTDGSAEHLVARRSPDSGKTATSDAHYIVGSTVTIPTADELSVTTNIDTVVERITSVVGIGLNVHEPPNGQTRAPLTAKLRHALAFVFQPQTEISQPGFLFHKQSDNWVEQAIKDTLPFFLGAVDDEYVAGKARLKELRRRLRERERTLARLEAVTGEGIGGGAALLAEAREVGILAQEEAPESWEEAVQVLREAETASPEEQLVRYEQSIDQAEFGRLNDERHDLRQQLRQQQDELDAMRALLSDEGGFTREAGEQVSRLTSLQLFAPSESAHCPLCDQPTSDQIPSYAALRAEMERASEQLDQVTKHAPGLEALALQQEHKVDETKRLLRENRSALEALRRADDRLTQLRDSASRRAHVLGRISLFIESLPQVEDSSALRNEVGELQRDIERLETDLGDDKIQERVESILSVIAKHLTEWAERLELEHKGNPFRLDLRRLQVVADADTGAIPMDQMGSGANWVGCHLIAHLALH